jgi:hypothetical protein
MLTSPGNKSMTLTSWQAFPEPEQAPVQEPEQAQEQAPVPQGPLQAVQPVSEPRPFSRIQRGQR